MRLNISQTTPTFDLADLLRGEYGTFLAQQGGQSYVVVAAEGHSIKSLTPVGPRIAQPAGAGASAEPWIVTKLSNQEIDFHSSSEQYRREEVRR
jgi:hypothetical protein